MKFKIGQHVIIKKNLGEKSGEGRDRYYYGGSLREVSLGSRGVVVEPHNSHYKIKANGVEVCLVEEEFAIDEEHEKEQRKEYESLLEGVLADEEPVEKKSRGERKFEPKFNAREEFAVWMMQEFPEIFNDSGNYENVTKRREEVYKAAKLACEHGVRTTELCVLDMFYSYLDCLSDYDDSNFGKKVSCLIRLIESLAPNLNRGELHYGTELKY